MVIGGYANEFVKRTSVKQIFDTLAYAIRSYLLIRPIVATVSRLTRLYVII